MNIKLQDLTFDIIQQLFADKLNQKYGQLNFPNASDSTTIVRDERDLERWKTGIMNGYGNVELELNPEGANSREQIKVLDQKFIDNKNRYIDTKASYLDSERSAGRTSGLDEELINEFGPDAKDEMSPSEYIQYCLERYREYRILAMDPTINSQATKLYLDKASDYYARAQEAMDEIEPDMTDHLSDEDKALPNVPLDEAEEDISVTDQMIQQLISMAEKGEFDNDQIRNLGQQLTSARKRYFTAQRSPESYKAAAEKAKQTKIQQKIDGEAESERSRKMANQQDAIIKARRDGGMLPYSLDDYNRKPNPKYYTFIMNDPGSGVGLYKLRDKYKNTVIGTKNEDGTVNPVTDTDIYAPQGVRPSMKSYMEEVDTNRWAKLAGINEYSSTDFDTYKVGDQIELDPKYFQAFELPDGYVGTVKSVDQADYADETPVYTVKLKNIDPFGDEHEYINVEYKQVK